MAKKIKGEILVDNSIGNTSTTPDIQPDEVQPITITLKQELEAVLAEMNRLGVNNTGQIEVKISQQK